MIAVAILAAVFAATSWVVEMRDRAGEYRRRALEFHVAAMHMGSRTETADGRWVGLWDDENSRLQDEWAWRLEAKYMRLSYYPWKDAGADPPPPQPLAHPRSALVLPEQDFSTSNAVFDSRPPAWTFLWTWHAE